MQIGANLEEKQVWMLRQLEEHTVCVAVLE